MRRRTVLTSIAGVASSGCLRFSEADGANSPGTDPSGENQDSDTVTPGGEAAGDTPTESSDRSTPSESTSTVTDTWP